MPELLSLTEQLPLHTEGPLEGTGDWEPAVSLVFGDWEWTEFHAYWSPSARRYFWHYDSGCSCNAWGEDLRTAADFENGDKDGLLRGLRAFAEHYDYTVKAPALLEAMAAVVHHHREVTGRGSEDAVGYLV